jgi:hypothetical protein
VGSRTITVAWQPPPIAEPPVTGYQVSVAGGSTVSTAGTSARITGLSPRTSYTVTVKAINTKGASLGVRLLAVTDKDISEPRNLTSLPVSSKDSVRLAWLPPLDNGGSPIREYRISWNAGGEVKTQVTSDTAATIAGLKTGTRYTLEVRRSTRIETSRRRQDHGRHVAGPAAAADRPTGRSRSRGRGRCDLGGGRLGRPCRRIRR